MKNVFLVTNVYITTIVGAGFASGQEIVSFFVKYGRISFLGVIFASLLFGLFSFAVLNGSRRYNCETFNDYMHSIANYKVAEIINIIIFIFMASVFFTMMSGSGETFAMIYHIPKMYGVGLICILCFIVFISDTKNTIMSLNGIIGVVIIFGIIGVCFYILNFRELQTMSVSRSIIDNWALSSTSYVSYNVLTASVILVLLSKNLTGKYDAHLVGIFSTIIIFSLLFSIWVVISIYYGKIPLGEIPMLTLTFRIGNKISFFYGIVLFSSLLTTALVTGYSVIEIIKKRYNMKNLTTAIIVVVIGYFCGSLKFSFLVDILYRGCGYMGFILIVCVIYDEIKSIKNIKNIKRLEK